MSSLRQFSLLTPLIPLLLLAAMVWPAESFAAQLTMTWIDNSNNEDGFQIERKQGQAGTFSRIATVGANVSSYTDSGLADGTTYCYKVRAFNAIGNAIYSNEACSTTHDGIADDGGEGDTTWWNANWLNRRKMTFDNSASAEDLMDFPVLVSLTSAVIDYTETQDAGQDIRFIDADGTTELAYEIEKWDESGTSVVWVKIPQIDAGSTTDHIWIYHNNSTAVDNQNAPGVWSNGYAGVWHLDEDPSGPAPQIKDRTSNTNDGTTEGSMISIDSIDAKIGNGLKLDGLDDLLRVPDSISLDSTNDEATFGLWIKWTDSASGKGQLVMSSSNRFATGANDGFEWASQGSGNHFFYPWGGDGSNYNLGPNPFVNMLWHYLVVTLNSSTKEVQIYVDGTPMTFATENVLTLWTTFASPNDWFWGGNSNSSPRYFDGVFDEIRVSDVVRSIDWINAQYKAMDGSFNTFGGEEFQPAAATGAAGTSIISGTVDGQAITDNVIVSFTSSRVGPILDLAITSTPDPVQAGEQITYTLTFSNSGAADLTALDVTLIDTLPTNTTFVAASDGGIESGGVVAWSLGDLTLGVSGTRTLVVRVDSPLPDGSLLTNSATLGDSQGDSATASQTTLVESASVLSLSISDSPDPAGAEEKITYALSYGNSSAANETASGVTLTDTLPANSTFISASDGGTLDGSGTQIVWSLGDLAPGASGTRTLVVQVDSPLPNGTLLTNSATLEDFQGDSAIASQATSVQSAPILSLSVTDSPDPVEAGAQIFYTLTFGNSDAANETALGVTLTDTLPSNAILISASDGGTLDTTGTMVTWSLGDLAPGSSGSRTLVVEVDSSLSNGTLLTNNATLEDNQGDTANSSQSSTVEDDPVLLLQRQNCVWGEGSVLYSFGYRSCFR